MAETRSKFPDPEQLKQYPDKDGYLRVFIDGVWYSVHSLVWYRKYGTWPTELDHIDRDRTNNAIDNLRLTTRSLQMLNSGKRSNHGYPECDKGVTYVGYKERPYRVQIKQNGEVIHRSTHATVEEANAVAKEVYAELERKAYG